MNYSTPEKHAIVMGRLRDSEPARYTMGCWMIQLGYETLLEETSYAPRHEDWRDNVDNGDIWIKRHGRNRRVEVKGTKWDFTVASGWWLKEFYVCDKRIFDDADPRPMSIFRVSRDLTHACMAIAATHPTWTTKWVPDRDLPGRESEIYLCPVDLVRVFRIGGPDPFP